MTFRCLVFLVLAALLVACGKTPRSPAPVAAPVSAVAPAAATASTSPAAVTVPPTTTAAAATTAASASSIAAPSAASDNGPEIAGSVALAQGSVSDTAKDGSVRQLKDGDDVYPGDSFVVGPDSYLDMDLEDTGRILLRPNTTFQIESYHFEPAAHDPDGPVDANGQPLIKPQQPENAFFRLVKGGLRAIDGVIGHSTPQNYAVETPVATIGVRGTAFDVRYCGDDCSDEADTAGSPENGLYTSVSDGTVDVKNDDGDVVTPAGHSGFVKSRKQRMRALATPPKALRHMSLPEKFKARADKNRGQLKARRQQRWQRTIERRRAALQKARAAGKPADLAPRNPEKRLERRQERLEKRREQAGQKPGLRPSDEKRQQTQERGHGLRRQEREQDKQQAAPGPGRPAAAGQAPLQGREPTLRERRQQLRQERQQAGQKQHEPAATRPAAKPAQQRGQQQKQPDEARCKAKHRGDGKDKKKDQAKEKDQDKCGGD